MRTQLVNHTSGIPIFFLGQQIAWAGPDDSGIRRGDREDTGDNQAAPDQMGYEPTSPAEDQASENDTENGGDYYDGME